MRVDAYIPGTAGRYRVLLDGVDISGSCFEADDQEGWAHCYVTDDEGRILKGKHGIDPDKVMCYGEVEIVDTKAAA